MTTFAKLEQQDSLTFIIERYNTIATYSAHRIKHTSPN